MQASSGGDSQSLPLKDDGEHATNVPPVMAEPDSDTDTEFEFDEGDKPIWDMFQLIPRDRISPSESFEGMLKGLRLLVYIFLFLVVWIFSTASVGCFLLLVGAASKGHAMKGLQVKTNKM